MISYILLGLFIVTIIVFFRSMIIPKGIHSTTQFEYTWRGGVRKPMGLVKEKEYYLELEKTIKYPSEQEQE